MRFGARRQRLGKVLSRAGLLTPALRVSQRLKKRGESRECLVHSVMPSMSPISASPAVLRACTTPPRAGRPAPWWLGKWMQTQHLQAPGESVWLLLPRKAHLGLPAWASPLPSEEAVGSLVPVSSAQSCRAQTVARE